MKGPNQVAPGHRLVITQNCRGLKSENRLDHCLASLCLLSPDVIMLQETGLHKDTDASRLRKLANRWQYAVAASYITSTSTRGGTAVLLRREAFGLKPNVEIDPKWIKRGMGGINTQRFGRQCVRKGHFRRMPYIKKINDRLLVGTMNDETMRKVRHLIHDDPHISGCTIENGKHLGQAMRDRNAIRT